MSKLHELLAVESDREAAATAILAETANTFSKKPDHFIGRHTTYKPFDEAEKGLEEDVTKELVDTVPSKLEHCFSIVAKAIDVTASKDATNQHAGAAIVINGTALSEKLPATTLLMLENRVKKWQELFLTIPTLAPGSKWEEDKTRGAHIYIDVNPDKKFRTKKVLQHKVLVEPTEHHPAQIEKWAEDVRVGAVTETVWCGMMSPADKAALLARTGELLAAIKQARQRANMEDVVQMTIAKPLIDFLLG